MPSSGKARTRRETILSINSAVAGGVTAKTLPARGHPRNGRGRDGAFAQMDPHPGGRERADAAFDFDLVAARRPDAGIAHGGVKDYGALEVCRQLTQGSRLEHVNEARQRGVPGTEDLAVQFEGIPDGEVPGDLGMDGCLDR